MSNIVYSIDKACRRSIKSLRRVGWIMLLTIATVVGNSFVLACAAPFPALAALAAFQMNRGLFTGLIWIRDSFARGIDIETTRTAA